MAVNLQAASIADVLVSSLQQLGKLKFTDLTSDYQNTIALKRIFRKHKATIEDGPFVQFNIMHSLSDSFRPVPIGYVSVVDIPNVMTTGSVAWRHVTWNWAVERRLIAMNSGRAKIVDIAMEQRMAALGGAILGIERMLWRCPTLAESALHPFGIPYYVTKSSTAATAANADGFNGGLCSDHATVANVNLTDFPRFKNYADAYTDVSKPDLVRKMRRAIFKTDFMPLVDGMPTYDTGNDYGIYTTYEVTRALEEILEAQNENLGNKLNPKDGSAVLSRTPITPVKELDQDTTGVVYILNWGEIGAQALSGEWMREQHFPAEANQPTISTTVTDCTYNLICRNRRKQAVLSTGTTMPS